MTSTELAVLQGPRTDLSIDMGQTFFNAKQIAALKQLGVKDATNGDLAVFFHQAVRTGLDPFAKQIYMIARWTKEGPKQTIQTGIDGYRLVARRAANRAGEDLSYEDMLWCGPDAAWTDVWLADGHPAAAKLVIYRGQSRFSAVALWREYVQTNKDGSPNAMWARMGANQLAKCCEALVLRKAYPQDLSGVYSEDEMPDPEPEPTTTITRAEPTTPKRVQRTLKTVELPPDVEPTFDEPAADELAEIGSITDPQSKMLHALFREKGFVDRADSLAYLSMILDREITTTKALSKIDATIAIDALQALDAKEDGNA